MKRKLILLSLFLIALLFVSGCWNRRELNDLAITVGMGIDKSGENYRVSTQVVIPSQVAGKKGGIQTPVTMYKETGESLLEAIRKMTTASPRKIYASHLRVLVLGESLAREGIGDALDLLSRDQELRTDFFIVIAKKTTAEKTLKILTQLEKIPSVNMFASLETSEKSWAPTTTITLDQLIAELLSEGKHPVLTGIQVIGSQEIGETSENLDQIDPSAKVKYSGLAVFKKDKLIGWLNEEESKAYTYINDEIKSTVGVITCPEGGKLSLEMMHSKTTVKGSVTGNQPTINIGIRAQMNIAEVQCSVDLTKTETIAELEKLSNQKLEGFIEASIKKVQRKYKVDIFGFGDIIHRTHPKAWKKLKKDWDQNFTKMPVTVKVDSRIRHLGAVSSSLLKDMEKKE
ncbi:Ger(x)C family spore germination protein [Paenibacillus mendelii]|uniref:Ger(X)C family spore germination protein n=1 Tax=Paenibacillus mendelii TaxID=206163 RepID=A0ABV6JF50_9BACL|nr:Ger(x)C family spore germination protein [Paenibacillus mendelii]MCQ6557406.1 Ger(x)C family spore germination protein [Paenibacillus mendelii]